MAIRFVDVKPEERAEAKKAAEPAQVRRPEAVLAGDAEARLPHAKPEPKARGRKKPLR